MTLSKFAKNIKRIQTQGTHATYHSATKPLEIIDDVVTVGNTGDGWAKTERNGRVYLSRR